MHEAQTEEEEQAGFGGLGSNNEAGMRQVPINVNRERRTRYQHPKGAPDADLIFGTKYESYFFVYEPNCKSFFIYRGKR